MLTALVVGLVGLNPFAAGASDEPIEEPTVREQVLDVVVDALEEAAADAGNDGGETPAPPAEEPVEPPTEEPVQPPAEEPVQPPTEEPTEPPVEPPAEPPVTPPTEEPTEPPTEQPPATPEAPTPANPPATVPHPEAPPPHRSPFARSEEEAAALQAEREALEAISAASVRLEQARAAHAQAEAMLDAAKVHYRLAQAAAERLDHRASAAERLAAAVDRLLASVIREREAPSLSPNDWVMIFEQADRALSSLGAAGRLRGLAADVQALSDVAAQHRERAEALREQADSAQAALVAIGIEQLRATVARAAAEVEVAERELQALQVARLAGLDELVPLAQDAGQLSDVGWVLPVTGAISGGYGWRAVKPLPGASSFHSGVDVAAACGTPVFAAAAGTVVDAGWAGGYGAMILIDHGSGVQTGYAHLPSNGMIVVEGQSVAAGQLIAVVGTTGVSTGCHLHFEVLIDGGRVNPIPFLMARGVSVTDAEN